MFKNSKSKGKGGSGSGDDRCPECGGVAGRHNKVAVSKRVPNPESRGNYKNEIRYVICPRR